MAMVCPQCNRAFGQELNCPECGGRLLFQAMSNSLKPKEGGNDCPQWQQTPWGRMAVGLILAQGLAYGLQQFLTAWILASGEQASIWTTLGGLVMLHGVQGFCLLLGGALCGAGKQRGMLYGSFVGLVNGLIFLMFQRQSGELVAIVMYGQPILHMALGALGGFVGTLIWKPTPILHVADPAIAPKTVSIPKPSLHFLSGPVYLGRVCLGIFIVVNGVVWSNAILNWMLNNSQGTFAIRTQLQAQLIGWEVCALATLFGAGLAGSNTRNGLKQGLSVGIGSSLLLAGVQLGNPKITLETTVLTAFGIMLLTIVGGWFGSQLLPPIHAVKKRKRILTG